MSVASGLGADERDAREILATCRTWAVVGLSPDPSRASHGVAKFLQSRGYRVVPVRPGADEILGETAHEDLAAVPPELGIDVVDVFRRSAEAGRHVDEAIAIGARAVWLQLGVIDEAAAERARAAGLMVVMDGCPAIEHPRLFGHEPAGWPAPAGAG